MKIYRLLSVIGCSALLAANLMAAKSPVEVFTGFRTAMENNDDAAARACTDGTLLKNLTDNGIPADLRKKIRLTTRVFENTFVRQNTHSPQQAELYTFYKQNGREVCLKITMQIDKSDNFRIISVAPGSTPPAKIAVSNFLTACYELDNQEYLLSVSPDIASRYPVIPEGLRPRAVFKEINPDDPNEFRTNQPFAESIRPDIEFKVTDAGNNRFNVTLGSNHGQITVSRKDLHWEITGISDELCHPQPFQVAEKFFNYFKIYNKHLEESGLRVKNEELAQLNKFITPMLNPSMAAFIRRTHLTDENIDRFAGFAGMETFKQVSPNKFLITFRVDSKTENGTMLMQLIKNGDQWQIDNFSNAARIYSKSNSPAIIAKNYFEKIYVPLNNTFKVVDTQEMFSGQEQAEVEVTVEFIQDEFTRQLTITVPFKLDMSAWEITSEPEKFDVFNTPEPEKELDPAPEIVIEKKVEKPAEPEALSW